jgi:hypothetical protein
MSEGLPSTERVGSRLSLPVEIVAVWAMVVAIAGAIVVTYARIPADELYHVSGRGLSGGASRALVFSNFSAALVAIAVLALLADRRASRLTTVVTLIGVVLCAAVFWPGVVDQTDLDAKLSNAITAVGVLVALALSGLALRGGAAWSGRRAGDRLRVVVGVLALALAVPWIAADLGFFLDGVPLLGWVFQTGVEVPESAGSLVLLPAVHHGHHHGMDGLLLLVSALLLSRLVPAVRRRGLRIAVGVYLPLMASYGIGNIANDAWGEQVVKRGWTTWTIPNVLRPQLSVAWGLIVLGAAAIYAASVWLTRREPDARVGDTVVAAGA